MGKFFGTGRDYIGDCNVCGAEFWGAEGHPDDEFDEDGVLIWTCPDCEREEAAAATAAKKAAKKKAAADAKAKAAKEREAAKKAPAQKAPAQQGKGGK